MINFGSCTLEGGQLLFYQRPNEKAELCLRANYFLQSRGCPRGGGERCWANVRCHSYQQAVYAFAAVPSCTTRAPARSIHLFDVFVCDAERACKTYGTLPRSGHYNFANPEHWKVQTSFSCHPGNDLFVAQLSTHWGSIPGGHTRWELSVHFKRHPEEAKNPRLYFFFHQVTRGIVAALVSLLCSLRQKEKKNPQLQLRSFPPSRLSTGHWDASHTKHWWLIPTFSSFIWSRHVFESRPNTAVPLWAALVWTACLGPDCCGKAFRGGPSEICVLVKQLPNCRACLIFLPSWHLNASKESV